MNEYQIKIIGSIEIPESLDSTKAVMVGVEVDLYSAEKRSKEDGDFQIVYRGRAVGTPLVSQGAKKYKAQVKSKQSRLWRWRVQEGGDDYHTFMSKMLENSDEIIDFVRKL